MPSKIIPRQAYGRYPALINLANDPIIAHRAPNAHDKWEKGQLWDDEDTNQVWMLTSYAAGVPVWTELDNNYLGIMWTNYVGAGPLTLAVNTGYTFTNASPVTVTLPVGPVIGSQIYLNDSNAAAAGAGLIVNAGAGQTIVYGAGATGVGGHADMLNLLQQTDSMWLIYTAANTWTIFTANGLVTLV